MTGFSWLAVSRGYKALMQGLPQNPRIDCQLWLMGTAATALHCIQDLAVHARMGALWRCDCQI